MPSLMRSVTAATAPSATNGSSMWLYSARQLAAGRIGRLAADRDVRVLGEEDRLEPALLGQPPQPDRVDRVLGDEGAQARRASGRVPADRQVIEAVDAVDRAELGLAVQLEARHPRRKERQRLLKLGARDVRAEAVVHARAEGEWLAVRSGRR